MIVTLIVEFSTFVASTFIVLDTFDHSGLYFRFIVHGRSASFMYIDEFENYTADGMDDVEFMISMNPGEPVRPLGEVASGGELSRIMLAIKTVMAEKDQIETLIFDEIDVGISGRTAQKVSEKMAVIGKNHQVICITHLAQIAAMADSHYLIEKKVVEGKTKTMISLLDRDSEIKELARILGGAEITDTVLKSAAEMKELARLKN